VSYKYCYSSWWWNWRDPKHVEVINKINEIYWEYCTPSCFQLQDHISVIPPCTLCIFCYILNFNLGSLNGRKMEESKRILIFESRLQNIQEYIDDRVRAECWENLRSSRRRNVAVNFWKHTKWCLSVPNSTSNMNGWLKNLQKY
jgi:hypothetical protein